MRRRDWQLVFVCLLVMTPLAVQADESDPRHWLQRMTEAATRVSFAGVLVYNHGGQVEALRVLRYHEGDRRLERINSLTGPRHEVLRDGREVTRILPEEGLVIRDRSDSRRRLTDLRPEQIRDLDSWYEISLHRGDRVADRDAVIIHLQPRDEFRYGYRLSVCEQSGLLLRSQMIGDDGQVLEQFMYVSVRTGDVDRLAVRPSMDHEGFKTLEVGPVEPPRGGAGEWVLESAPPGYRLLADDWRKMPGTGGTVRHLIYGDGLGSVSVYVAPEVGTAFRGRSGRGAMHVAGKIVDGFQVTVMGDVPLATVSRVLDGMVYRQ